VNLGLCRRMRRTASSLRCAAARCRLPHGTAERDAICEILVARYVGLLKAINNFDPQYGEGLLAYAGA
jgi:hypothetical protein